MKLTGNDHFIPQFSSTELSVEQEFIINKTLLTHEADGCRHVDCKILFQAMESVMFYASKHTNWKSAVDARILGSIESFDSKETLRHTILKMSHAILCECHNTMDIHTRTLVLLEMLGNYRWDAKVILILTAFSISYGEFRLILEVYSHNLLAASLAALKNLCGRNLEGLRPQFKAMEMVVKEMMELAKCVVRFEGLPLEEIVLYDDHDRTLMAAAKSQIYLATYWIFRSSLISASQITDLIATKQENSSITANAAWGLSSLALRLSRLCSCLRMLVDAAQDQIEQKVYKKLMNLVKDQTQVDNQQVLHLFFSLNDDLPLKDSSSQAKVGISRLKHKVVMLLVSKPDLLPIDQTLLLLQQTKEHPHNKSIEQDYEIVWVPSSETWTLDEHMGFDYLSNSLPWLSVRQPWLLNSAVVRMIREEWKFEEDPLMVVLDSVGVASNYNAIDMVLIWGPKAFPFSNSREKELWELEEPWNLQLMFDGIDHFLTKTMVKADENICICGTSNLDWINEFESRIEKLRNVGLQLRVIYVGSRNANETTRTTLAVVNKDNSLTPTKIRLFWLRLERIRDSILRVGRTQTFPNYETLLKQVSELLETDDRNNNWAIFGCGSSKDFVKLEGNKIMEFFDRFPIWAERVAGLGFVGAIRSVDDAVNLTAACDHTAVVPYDEGMVRGTMVCDKCKRTMKPYVGYQCDGSKLNVSS
ncbi:protein SIEVE ELEMENT OCCLUSION C [Cynara cardunculus var. scolymus]|uniref:protein SIEVE ELEMENT OCCLUSION C n=1 Tax=Cynara cardunculus var. scolymus TaxID=59895 RepID=UPI000D62BA23|nr:protein SIEVE ELEMENT OCCLUSION C [Cynara cardunculus var. scolymus]